MFVLRHLRLRRKLTLLKWFRKCKLCGKEGNYQRPADWNRNYYNSVRCKYCLTSNLDMGGEKEVNLVTGKIVEDEDKSTT